MWKDFLHFSQIEKRGLLVLITLILIIIFINVSLPFWVKSEPIDFTEFKAQVDAYYASKETSEKAEKPINQSDPLQLFLVDTVSEKWLIEHGLSSFVASNFIKYRNSKGQFSSLKDVEKVYGLNDSILKTWRPFMVFSDPPPTKEVFEKHPPTISTNTFIRKKTDFQVDINSADTAIFQAIYSIGPAFASRIVKYRNLLGGYYSIDQISEVYGMDSIRFESIKPYLRLDTVDLRPIKINTASLKSMKGHPYLNFYQAKAIYEFRNNENWIENWEQLITIKQLDTIHLKFIQPYLNYSHP